MAGVAVPMGPGGRGGLTVDDLVEVLVLVLGAGVVGEVARVGDLDDVLLLGGLLGVFGVGWVVGLLWVSGGLVSLGALLVRGRPTGRGRDTIGLTLGLSLGDLGGDRWLARPRGLGRHRRLGRLGRLDVVGHLLGLLGGRVTHPPAQEAGERRGGGMGRVVGHGHMVPRPGDLVGR